jgi:hypothetical protein
MLVAMGEAIPARTMVGAKVMLSVVMVNEAEKPHIFFHMIHQDLWQSENEGNSHCDRYPPETVC